jgi:hypothetical protein
MSKKDHTPIHSWASLRPCPVCIKKRYPGERLLPDPPKMYVNRSGEFACPLCGYKDLQSPAKLRKKADVSADSKSNSLAVLRFGKVKKAEKDGNGRWEIRPVRCIETGDVFKSITEATALMGVAKGAIAAVLRGRQETAGDLHWEEYDANKKST